MILTSEGGGGGQQLGGPCFFVVQGGGSDMAGGGVVVPDSFSLETLVASQPGTTIFQNPGGRGGGGAGRIRPRDQALVPGAQKMLKTKAMYAHWLLNPWNHLACCLGHHWTPAKDTNLSGHV